MDVIVVLRELYLDVYHRLLSKDSIERENCMF